MSLPKIDLPVYSIKIPSNGKTVKVRPFTVKEEKLLLMALESNEVEDVIQTTKQVINNCVVTGDINVDKLPFFDIDYLFIFLRAKSVGEEVSVRLTCNNIVDGEKCGNVFPSKLNVNNCEMIMPEEVTNDIKFDDNNSVKMKYPTYSQMKRIEKSDIDIKTSMIVNCIDVIVDKTGIHSAKDYSKEELKEFVEGLTQANYRKLEEFVDNFPTFAVTLEDTCPKCNFHHKVRYTDFYDFFS